MQNSEAAIQSIHPVAEHILNVLAYHDIFNYPLTKKEIYGFIALSNVDETLFDRILAGLLENTFIHQLGSFYSLQSSAELAERRKAGNNRAARSLQWAKKISRFIGGFPFVRCVMLSGTLSKHYMEKESDFDFFVITQPGRLWIARTLLMIFKKIFLLNSFKYFCVNYFIDTEHLEIEEKNLFTAMELVTLIPAYNGEMYSKFYDANDWAKNFYPNFPRRGTDDVPSGKSRWFKNFAEQCLDNRFTDTVDAWLMNLTVHHWRKIFTHLNADEFMIALKSKPHVSKHHPKFYQKEILKSYRDKITAVEKALGIILHHPAHGALTAEGDD